LDWTIIATGTLAGLATGFATLVGAAAILFGRGKAAARQDVLLGFAAGVMLSASYLSLIVPAASFASDAGHGDFAAALMVGVAVLVGAGSLDWLRRSDRLSGIALGQSLPPEVREAHQRVWLLVVAMTAHNLPEGAAVGVGFAADEPRVALGTAIGIGVQNLPEGMAVAGALLTLGWSRNRAVLVSGATGVMEPLGALIAVTLVSLVAPILPFAMGWAAGAMLYIVAAELIPAIHREGAAGRAMAALMVGLAAMLVLDIALG
jgi:zinc transporter, ZIP family